MKDAMRGFIAILRAQGARSADPSAPLPGLQLRYRLSKTRCSHSNWIPSPPTEPVPSDAHLAFFAVKRLSWREMTASVSSPQAVLEFWLGTRDDGGWSPPDRVARWFKKDPAFDALLVDSFLETHRWVRAQHPAPWQDCPENLLAYVLVLDQMSRNMFRGTPGMFESDAFALAASKHALEQGWDQALQGSARVFLYMPLMHAESLDEQEQCVQCFSRMLQSIQGPRRNTIASNLHFAERHRDIIARFGRFPHRNQVLSRQSTSEEIEFLTQPGSSF